jgi:hypothetical protein
VGTYQWLSVSALVAVGVDTNLALAFALLMQAVWFVPTTIVGGPIAHRESGRDLLGRRHADGEITGTSASGQLATDESA